MGTFGGVCGWRRLGGAGEPAGASAHRRTAGAVTVALVGVLSALAMGAGPAYAQHNAPPALYVNPRLQPIVATCEDPAITEISLCPTKEVQHLRSINVAFMAWGSIGLTGGLSSYPLSCTSLMNGILWREHEHSVEAEPIRTYGSIEGWGATQCSAPSLLAEWKRTTGDAGLSVFATAEQPLEESTQEGEICDAAEYRRGHNKLSKCPLASEREDKQLITSAMRPERTLPWKEEFVWGRSKAFNQPGVQVRLGMGTYGECGPGTEEEPANGAQQTCTAQQQNTACYPASGEVSEVPAGCIRLTVVIPQIPVELPVYGSLEAIWRNGTGSGLTPGSMELWEGYDGQLLPNESGGSAMNVRGDIREIGEAGQALLTFKDETKGE
jgi:hypothetical protein